MAEAQRMYIDYHCYGNTLHTSDEEMGYIVHEYSDQISRWRKSVTDDVNEYKFDDSEFENWKAQGKQDAKESAGYENTNSQRRLEGARAYGSAAVNGLNAMYASGRAANGAATAIGNAVANASGSSSGAASAAAKGGGSAYIQAGIAIATLAAYMVKKPNEEQAKACDDLLEQMTQLQQELVEYQGQMETMAQEISEATEEAQTVNEEANDSMDTSKTEYDVFVESYSALVEKAKTEGLTDEERTLVENLFTALAATGDDIDTTQEDAQTIVGDIYSDLGTYQEGYDEAARGMANVQGVTEYAEEFDVSTHDKCNASAIGQAANAITGAFSGAKLIAMAASHGWWGIADVILGGAAIAAGAGSGLAANEQRTMAQGVQTEIDSRTATQGLNENTRGLYDQEINNYEISMGNVENLELIVPEDVGVPTETIPNNQPQQNQKPNGPTQKGRFGKYTSK